MKSIGLSLGEGGARGLAHIAYISVFEDLNIKPSIISGSSMGALIGALYASGHSTKSMIKILDSISFFDYNNMLDFAFNKGGLIKGDGIVDLLAKHFSNLKFEDLEIPLKIVATDYWSKKPYVFDTGEILPALRASISIPGIFKPFKYKGHIYIDGGCTLPVPFNIIREYCDVLVAIDVSTTKTPKRSSKIVPNIYEIMFNTYYIMMSSIVENMRANIDIEIYENPGLENIRIMDFYKYQKIVNLAKKSTDSFREKLEKFI